MPHWALCLVAKTGYIRVQQDKGQLVHLSLQEYDNKLKDMEQQYEEEKVGKAKLEQDMAKLRAFYDEKLNNVDGELKKIPSTAEGNIYIV